MAERWWLDDDHRTALSARTAFDVAAWMQSGDGRTLLSSDRQSAAVRWDGEPPLLVKWRAPIPGRKGKTLLRPSRERAEARIMRAAAEHGIPCPAPWAVGERRRLGVLVGAVMIRAYDPDASTAAEAAREEPGVLFDVAYALGRWHKAGFVHGDCYPKNILVGGEAREPRPIGCPKATLGQRLAPLSAPDGVLKDLAQYAVGCAALHSLGDPFAFLTAWGEVHGHADYDALVARITPFYEKILERKAERVRSRPEREPEGPPQPTPLPTGGDVRARMLPIDAL